MMTATQIIEGLGGTVQVANALGLAPTTVSSWKSANSIPKWRMPGIEQLAQKKGFALGSQAEGRGGGSGNSIGTADAAAAPDVSPPPPSTGEAEAGGVLPCAPGGGV